MIRTEAINKCEKAAHNMRQHIMHLAHQACNHGSHVGPALSIVEIMAVLYLEVLKLDTENLLLESRDRFILSKGHGALGYYVAMYEAGVISREDLYAYEINGGIFPGQPSKCLTKGIEYSGGSLGMGLSYGAGIALAAKRSQSAFKTYVLMGDGELNEGVVWESAMFARHQGLANLTVIVDRNNMQSDGSCGDILSYDVEGVWRGFGWEIVTCDGHSVGQLMEAFQKKNTPHPKVIIATTTKGKGVSFMENAKDWHHNRLTADLYQRALAELEATEVGSHGI